MPYARREVRAARPDGVNFDWDRGKIYHHRLKFVAVQAFTHHRDRDLAKA
jgi:hypothetical protein